MRFLSVLDFKAAYHSLRLLENSRRYCRILPYFGSTSYLYQRMPMGLNISPSICQSYINTILECFIIIKFCLLTEGYGSPLLCSQHFLYTLYSLSLACPRNCPSTLFLVFPFLFSHQFFVCYLVFL